jgi:hypothetical protein
MNRKKEEMNEQTQKVRAFLESLQGPDGSFTSKNTIKATSEYLLVHRFCPQINIGTVEKAQKYLISSNPVFALHEVRKGFKSMEKIWQISVGIPDKTLELSQEFLDLSISFKDNSVKSALLMVLFLQKIEDNSLGRILESVIDYQKTLWEIVSLDTLYETTHNLMTFHLARTRGFNTDKIISKSCTWLSSVVFSRSDCIDLLAETVGVTFLCGYENISRKAFSTVLDHQNEDGGFPIFAGGKSEFHPSLVSLWALTAQKM